LSFLEALKIFISNIKEIDSERIVLPAGSPGPDKIIFDTVNQLLAVFKSFKKSKNPNIPDIRFELLGGITYEKLIKEGFKSVCINSKDDEDAKERVSYLIRQYYDRQYLLANPKVQQLNDDVKEILKQFAVCFPQAGKAKYTHHKIITLSGVLDLESFKDYSFSKNEPKKSRLKEVFFTIHQVLQSQPDKSISYSDLINELKSKLGIFDNEEVPFPDENKSGQDEKIDNDYVVDEFKKDNFTGTEDNDEFSKNNEENLDEKNATEKGFNLLPINSENLEFGDSIILVNAFNQFINLCTERQRIIFGFYLLKEDVALIEDIASEIKDKEKYKELKNSLNENFKKLTKSFRISSATLYLEKDTALENLKFVFKKFEMDESEKQTLIRNIISYFEDYLSNNGN
jgi:hypothetical protein